MNIADSVSAGPANGIRSPGRVGEWRDNANSQAVLMCDRNSAANTLSPRSNWATSAGSITDWKGNVVWGDNHAEFDTQSAGFTTKYLETVNTSDSLFNDGSQNPTPGDSSGNAFFNYVSANY